MAVSNLNQVRHLFVAEKLVEKTANDGEPGALMVGVVGENTGAIDKQIYFTVNGVDGAIKSDYIPVKSITYAKATDAKDARVYLKKVVVALDKNVNEGAPIVGQDYILRINLRQFYGMGDQDQYFKDAAVRATKGMTAEEFYKAMVSALNASFSREVGATATENPYLYFEASADGITIIEKNQPWTLGVEAQERVYFDVVPTTVYCDGVDVIWGTATVSDSTYYITNGHAIADLEYFLLGERGDQYRKIGWPNDIETKGQVDPTQEYNVLDIHYSFSDTGVNNYKTEKDITLVSTSYSVINSIIAKINAAAGTSINTIAGES